MYIHAHTQHTQAQNVSRINLLFIHWPHELLSLRHVFMHYPGQKTISSKYIVSGCSMALHACTRSREHSILVCCPHTDALTHIHSYNIQMVKSMSVDKLELVINSSRNKPSCTNLKPCVSLYHRQSSIVAAITTVTTTTTLSHSENVLVSSFSPPLSLWHTMREWGFALCWSKATTWKIYTMNWFYSVLVRNSHIFHAYSNTQYNTVYTCVRRNAHQLRAQKEEQKKTANVLAMVNTKRNR